MAKIQEQLSPPPTKDVPEGGKNGGTKTVVDQDEVRKLNSQKNNISFYWQSRYYDRVIRNEKSLNIIRQYIIDNPYKGMAEAALTIEALKYINIYDFI